jgi:hypothetical protein
MLKIDSDPSFARKEGNIRMDLREKLYEDLFM